MSYFQILGSVLFVYMSFWFLVSLVKKRNDVADTAWGLGFVLLTWVSYFLSGNADTRVLIVNTLVTIWGARLAWHIHKRNKGKTEDYRYLAWRNEWGKWFYLRSYLQVYLLQGFFLFLIVSPVLTINKNSISILGVGDVIGFIIWIIGFTFESVGDSQLKKFISKPENKGKLMREGLWQYTRHPNYFGEVMQWWGIWVVSLSVANGFYTIVGPLTITYLILKVSGVPMLEKKMEENPDFIDYKKQTSVFIPWFKAHK